MIDTSLKIYRTKFAILETKYNEILDSKKNTERSIESLKSAITNNTEARKIVNEVMIIVQKGVEDFISEVGTLALQIVMGEGYKFICEYNVYRNKNEVFFYVEKDSERFELKDTVGGTIINICSLALRFAVYFLLAEKKKIRPVFFLDEPGRCVSSDLRELYGEMIKRTSEYLGFQIIMISHDYNLMEISDTVYEISQVDNISQIRKLK